MRSFEGVIRGYQVIGPGMGLAAAIVEVDPAAEVPESGRLLDYGPLVRGDGLELARAIAVVGELREISEIVAALIEQPAIVTLGPDGAPYIRAAEEDQEPATMAEPGAGEG